MTAVLIIVSVLLLVLVVGAAYATVTRARRRTFEEEAEETAAAGRGGARTAVKEAPPPVAAPEEAPPEAAPAPEEAAPPTGPPRLAELLGKTRGLIAGYLGKVRSRGSVDAATWDDLEEALLRADVGVATTQALLEDLRSRVVSRELSGPDEVLLALRGDLVALLSEPGERHHEHLAVPADLAEEAALDEGEGEVHHHLHHGETTGRELRFDDEPGVTNVWLFVGVNGVGKTTTIGKVARQQVADGRSVLLAAGDTFRAAAGEQLARWGDRVGAEIVRGAEGGDPSAIVFDAVQRASARGNDLVLADTAGRLHTKVNLIEELKKIRRVAERPPGRVTEVLLVLDAVTGQNGLVQAQQFTEAVGVTGVVLTKLDGTAKGGVVVAIQRELGLPVKLVGLGEGPDDLVPFDPEEFVDALIG